MLKHFEILKFVTTLIEIKRNVYSAIGTKKKLRFVSFSSIYFRFSSSRLHDTISSPHRLPIQHLHSSQRLRKDERELDVDEEHWFNDDADETKLTSLTHGTIFNGGAGSDDEDSQPELTGTSTSAISSNDQSSRPPPSHHRTDHDDETETTSIRTHQPKPMISIHIRRSPLTIAASPSTTNDNESSRSESPNNGSPARPMTPTETSSTFAMVKKNKHKKTSIFFILSCFQSPGLSSIADQYNDEDDDDDDDTDAEERTSINSDSQSSTRKRKIDQDDDDDQTNHRDELSTLTSSSTDNLEQSKVFKRSNDQSSM